MLKFPFTIFAIFYCKCDFKKVNKASVGCSKYQETPTPGVLSSIPKGRVCRDIRDRVSRYPSKLQGGTGFGCFGRAGAATLITTFCSGWRSVQAMFKVFQSIKCILLLLVEKLHMLLRQPCSLNDFHNWRNAKVQLKLGKVKIWFFFSIWVHRLSVFHPQIPLGGWISR